MLLVPCQASCYDWNSKKWEGASCGSNPERTDCGCSTCTRCDETVKNDDLCQTNFEVRVGSSSSVTKSISIPKVNGEVSCPATVDKNNRIKTDFHSYGDTWSITVSGETITARRTDKQEGWDLDLRFMCSWRKADRSCIQAYTHVVRGCVSGENIQRYKDKSIPECEALCTANSRCKAFEYGVDPRRDANGEYEPRACVLQSSANMDGCDGAAYNLDLYIVSAATTTTTTTTGPDCQGSFRKTANAAIFGFNKETARSVSPEDCMKICCERSWCNSFDYMRGKRCKIF